MINELRQVVLGRLNNLKTEFGITDIGYRQVRDDSLFPHIVVDFTSITPTDMGREDFLMDFNVFTKDPAVAFDIADAVRDELAFLTAPDDLVDQMVLPTFFEESSGEVDDPDKTVTHLVLRYQVQTYTRDAENSTILGKE